MGINQVEVLNQKRFEKKQEVEIFLNNLNSIAKNRAFNLDIKEITFELIGLIDKFSRDSINISILSEVSSGKSTFLNALIFNNPILESKIGETTAKIFNIKYDEKYSIDGVEKKSIEDLKKHIVAENSKNLKAISQDKGIDNIQSIITLPNENLKKGIEIYDTPGFATLTEDKIINLLKEVVSKSDATILLLDISQGIKESEHLFIKTILRNIKTNKRFIVLNKYDTIIGDDDLALKSEDEIKDEIDALIYNMESTLQGLQTDTSQNIKSFHLSAKKALVGKVTNDNIKLEESRFPIFEEFFWKRVVDAKSEVFEDNIDTFDRVKDSFKELLKKEKKNVEQKKTELELKLAVSLESESRILTLERDMHRLKKLNVRTKESQRTLVSQERRLREDILYILKVNLASELTTISFFQKLQFWTLKKRYQKSIISVVKDARSYIVQHINSFISNATKERRETDAILWSINQNLTHLLVLPKQDKNINVNQLLDRVVTRMDSYVEWKASTLFHLLKYNIVTKDSKALEPSYLELIREISDIKRANNNALIKGKSEREHYIELVEKEIEKMKKTMEERGSLEKEIEELTFFIEEINIWINS